VLDDALLFSPGAAFADACYASLDNGPSAPPARTSRRSEWVQNFRLSDDERADEDDDERVHRAYSLRPSIDDVAPWACAAHEAGRPLSVIQFRRPSATSDFGLVHDLDTSALCAAPASASAINLAQDPAARGRSPPPPYHSQHVSFSLDASAQPASPASSKKRFNLGFGRR
jgi:hypothetical protein